LTLNSNEMNIFDIQKMLLPISTAGIEGRRQNGMEKSTLLSAIGTHNYRQTFEHKLTTIDEDEQLSRGVMDGDDRTLFQLRPPNEAVNKVSALTATLSPYYTGTIQLQPKILRRLGIWNLAIVSTGGLSILGILGFLWFLWLGDESSPFWKWLILGAYLQRIVTFSSVILWTAVTFQSTLCIAMIAAALIEWSGFRLIHSATLSIQRSKGGQPVGLLTAGVFRPKSRFPLVMAIILSITSLSSTFISTALVADLGLRLTAGQSTATNIAYSLDIEKATSLAEGEALGYPSQLAVNFPTFAEYKYPISHREGIDNTGLLVRALFPISSGPTREILSNYTGPGTLMSS
jgi:hypothetical protein